MGGCKFAIGDEGSRLAGPVLIFYYCLWLRAQALPRSRYCWEGQQATLLCLLTTVRICSSEFHIPDVWDFQEGDQSCKVTGGYVESSELCPPPLLFFFNMRGPKPPVSNKRVLASGMRGCVGSGKVSVREKVQLLPGLV